MIDKVTKGTEPFYENLEMAIENLLNDVSTEETFDWEFDGVLGFKAYKEGDTVKVEIKSGKKRLMEAVKGLQGRWHATMGDWYDGNSLRTLCGRGISPNYRRFNEQDVRRVVNCPKCHEILKDKG